VIYDILARLSILNMKYHNGWITQKDTHEHILYVLD